MAHHKYACHHIFDRVCDEHCIEHRLTKVKHPWTNGQVERMNRTIKEATVKRYHYDSHAQLTAHLHDFIDAYNYGRRLKTLRGLTPYEYKIGRASCREKVCQYVKISVVAVSLKKKSCKHVKNEKRTRHYKILLTKTKKTT